MLLINTFYYCEATGSALRRGRALGIFHAGHHRVSTYRLLNYELAQLGFLIRLVITFGQKRLGLIDAVDSGGLASRVRISADPFSHQQMDWMPDI